MLLSLLCPAIAGPWVKDPGHHYVKPSAARFAAGDYVDPQVERSSQLSYSSWSAVLYAEVGVAPGLQIHANLPYLWAKNLDLDQGWVYAQSAPGDALVGLDWQLPVAPPASLLVQARLPMYADGDRPQSYPAMGDPQVDLDLQANIGHSLPWRGHSLWGVAEAGFRYRTPWTYKGNQPAFDYENGLPYRLQIGLSPTLRERPMGWVQVEASGLIKLGSDQVTKQWHQGGVGLALSLTPSTHLELGVQRIYAARYASLGDSVSVGVSHQR